MSNRVTHTAGFGSPGEVHCRAISIYSSKTNIYLHIYQVSICAAQSQLITCN